MILTVCLNTALDVTYHVPAVDWSGENRPSTVRTRPGGKGLNVARTLRAIGAEVQVLGLAGGLTGEAVTVALRELHVAARFVQIAGETRRTFAVADERCAAVALFNEPGPQIGHDEYREFRASYQTALGRCAAVVLSGSLPRGLPAATYAELTQMATAAGVPTVLDAHGEALQRGAAAGPAIVKPNLAELEAIAGRDLSTARGPVREAVVSAARALKATGPQAVVVSLGAEGLWAVTDEGSWQARPAADVPGNPTGAGDAVTAGLVHGLVLGRSWDEGLRHAVALGTASAAAPVAGEFSRADYAAALAGVSVHREEAAA